MYRLSYRDLTWDTVVLDPERWTVENGVRVRFGAVYDASEHVKVRPEEHKVSVGMPSGRGKISDAGYDQMVCFASEIPSRDHAVFRCAVRVLRYPSPEERNGQEGLGIFFRDTLSPDPKTGYAYSNMAAAGFFRGKPCLFGREGIRENETGPVRDLFTEAAAVAADTSLLTGAVPAGGGLEAGAALAGGNPEAGEVLQPDASACMGKSFLVTLEKEGSRLRASIAPFQEGAGEGCPVFVAETEADGEIFSVREADKMYLGFFAARGCAMEIDTDSVSVSYRDCPEAGARPAALYVSPEGVCGNPGTKESPLDLQTAVLRVSPGQEIRVFPGRYRMAEDLVIGRGNDGKRRARKRIRVEYGPGNHGVEADRAVLDFGGSENGFRIEGNNWEISGITVTGGYGFLIRGSHNRIHHCMAVKNKETGFLVRHPENDGPEDELPSYNEIADCVSFLNKDVSGQHADGFACKIAAGPGNVFLRCTAFLNADDGFDLFSKNHKTGAVKLFDCRSFLNGYTIRDGKLLKTAGNGNGFKLGGSGVSVDHEAVRCEASGNRGYGFTSNSNPHMHLAGCRAGNNRANYLYYFTGPSADAVYVRENCAEQDDPAFGGEDRAAELLKQAEQDPWVWSRNLKGTLTGPGAGPRAGTGARNGDAQEHFPGNAEDGGQGEDGIKDDRPGVLIMCSSLYGGGAERVACHLASGLSDTCRVTMLYIQDKGRTYDLPPGTQIVAMPYFEGYFERVMEQRAAFVRRLKEELRIQVSISFMFTMNKLNVRSKGTEKTICSERNSPAKRDPERIGEIASFYEAADHVVFQSETVRNLFSENVREHSSIILNPVSVSCLRSGGGSGEIFDEMSGGKSGRTHRIVHIGRLTPQKNQTMLLRAFAAFHKTHPEYTLSMYGEGELAEELWALADELGLNDAVRFHGQVRDVHRAAADAEMFVLSSDYEGLSNALLECMMMGFPCISTRCEGAVDIIKSGENGLLIDIGNEAELADAMVRLAEDPALRERLGTEARKTSEAFRAERVLGQWKELVGKML